VLDIAFRPQALARALVRRKARGSPRKCYYGRVRRAASDITLLRVPPTACIVPDGIFDAFGWCASDQLEWRRPAGVWDASTPVDGTDPARMVFVMRRSGNGATSGAFLPREPAAVHAFGLGLGDEEEALAPWAIDDATDGLYARRIRPGDALWLAADNLNALFWGLHDWAHFHNHGPFEQQAWTELQCDGAALAWLWENRERVPLADAAWEKVRREVVALSAARFEREGLALDERLLSAERVRGLVGVGAGGRHAMRGAPARATRS
jgi:hypothetical protein